MSEGTFHLKGLECLPTNAERIKFRNHHFATPDETVDVGSGQQLLMFLGERVMGNLAMNESGGRHLYRKRNSKSLKVGRDDIMCLLMWYLIQWQ